MKTIKVWLTPLVLMAALATSLSARASDLSLGAGYGLNHGGVISLYGDMDAGQPEVLNGIPLTVRFGLDHYSRDYRHHGWDYNVIYGGAYLDFQNRLNIDQRFHPIAGLGLGLGTTNCSGDCGGLSTPNAGGLWYIFGVQYDVQENLKAEASIRAWSGLTLGLSARF